MLTAPRATFTAVVAHPRWAAVLLLSVIVSAAAGYALMSTEVGRQAFVDQQVRSREAFGGTVNDAMYAQLQRMSEIAETITVVFTLVMLPLMTAGIAALLFGVFNALLGGLASYRQVLAVVAHAGVIMVVRQVFGAPLNYARESLASPTTLGIFFPMLDEASPAARFLGIIDLFVIWWVVVLAIGLSVLFGRPTRQLALSFIGVYVAIALVLAGVMAMTGGT
jgi:hypothetical protein